MELQIPTFITKDFLLENPNCIFIFGDNNKRMGLGGAAKLRYEPNTYGFITKKAPSFNILDYYDIEEYRPVFNIELNNLDKYINNNLDKIFLISRLGAGLANLHKIYENVIRPGLLKWNKRDNSNIKFLWNIERE